MSVGPIHRASETLFLPGGAKSLAGAVMILINEAENGLSHAELVEAMQPFTRSPNLLVRQVIRRQGKGGHLKRIGGRWFPASAPGKADVIPQQRKRFLATDQTC